MVLVEHSNLRSRVNDTTFHSFRSSAYARKKCRGWSQKTQTRGSFLITRTREGVLFSLTLSLVSEDFFESRARVTIRSSSHQNPRERGKISNERRLSTTTTTNKRTFFILDLRFHVIDGIRRLHFQGDGFARQGFHENLHLLLRLVY